MASLPKPKDTEWELELPEEREEVNVDVELSEEDAVERDRRNQALREAAEAAEFSRRTQVLQRALPRPSNLDIESLLKTAGGIPDAAGAAIASEMALLIANDAFRYPIPGAKLQGTTRPLEVFDDDSLSRAKKEIAKEMQPVDLSSSQKSFDSSWDDLHSTSSVLPGLAAYEEDDIASRQAMTEAFNVSSCPLVFFYFLIAKICCTSGYPGIAPIHRGQK